MLDCIHFSVFLFFEKPHLDSFSIDSYPSRPLDCFSRQILTHFRSIKAFWNLSWLLLDKFSIHRETFFLSFYMIVVQSIEVLLSSTDAWQHLDRFICRALVLDSSWHLFNPLRFVFLYIASTWFLFHFSPISLDINSLFSPKHFSPTLSPSPLDGMISFLSFIMHFIHLDLGFWFFLKNLGFFKVVLFVKFLG